MNALCDSLMAARKSFIFYDIDADLSIMRRMRELVCSKDKSLRIVCLPVVVIDGRTLLSHPTSFTALQAQIGETTHTQGAGKYSDTLDANNHTGAQIASFQRDMLNEINLARENPQQYAEKRLRIDELKGRDNGAYAYLMATPECAQLTLNLTLC